MSAQIESVAVELERLVALKERNVLSEAEFEAQKARLLASSGSVQAPRLDVQVSVTVKDDGQKNPANTKTEMVFDIKFPANREFDAVLADVASALEVPTRGWRHTRDSTSNALLDSIGLKSFGKDVPWVARFPDVVWKRVPVRYQLRDVSLTRILPTRYQLRLQVMGSTSVLGALFGLTGGVLSLVFLGITILSVYPGRNIPAAVSFGLLTWVCAAMVQSQNRKLNENRKSAVPMVQGLIEEKLQRQT